MTNDVVKYQETLVWFNLRLLLVSNLKTDVSFGVDFLSIILPSLGPGSDGQLKLELGILPTPTPPW